MQSETLSTLLVDPVDSLPAVDERSCSNICLRCAMYGCDSNIYRLQAPFPMCAVRRLSHALEQAATPLLPSSVASDGNSSCWRTSLETRLIPAAQAPAAVARTPACRMGTPNACTHPHAWEALRSAPPLLCSCRTNDARVHRLPPGGHTNCAASCLHECLMSISSCVVQESLKYVCSWPH